MTLKELVLEALDKVSEEEILKILGVSPATDEDAAKKLEQRRKMDRERQARHRANKAAKEAEEETAPESEQEEDFASRYEDKTAVDLFKLCKERGMKTVTPKKPQRFYIDLLVEADKKEAAAAKESEFEAEDEDWGEEEPAEEKKSAKKSVKKSSAKKEPAPAEDDEDEWEI